MKTSVLSMIIVPLTMLACQPDSEEMSMDQQAQQQDQMQEQFQQQQPATAVDVSDEELREFVDVSMVAQEIQMGAQSEMIAVVEEEGLDVETYNLIAEARFNGQSDEDLDVNQEDIEKFESASEAVSELEQELDAQMTEAIEAEGMEMERFMELNMALQQDPEMQQRVQEMMMQSQMEEQGAAPQGEGF
ncbi:DUF4168 domain-containing protein [Rhodohalobacter halophilus]|uniref:DUF4168 domain-containing protein n=1 Tax=Rhodohalobacter halophilus TaxID=1812810 RepID=UPI00083F56DD|nr:DUF4168 domain-containing protein [Rhodohalobacter halophilus]